MNKGAIVGALVVAAFVAGVVYLAPGAVDEPAATPGAAGSSSASGAAELTTPPGSSAKSSAAPSTAAAGRSGPPQPPADPRLIALAVSQDNGLIEFVRGADGRVITEIDNDPSSPSFRKPTREYMYSGDKVIGLTAYRYFADHTEISRTAVAYKPDGSVDRIVEDTNFAPTRKK